MKYEGIQCVCEIALDRIGDSDDMDWRNGKLFTRNQSNSIKDYFTFRT